MTDIVNITIDGVANIDTGVQFDHEALFSSYRGRLSNGSTDHNYNWFGPTCSTPCDDNGHGTHVTGIVGTRWHDEIAARRVSTAHTGTLVLASLDDLRRIIDVIDPRNRSDRPI